MWGHFSGEYLKVLRFEFGVRIGVRTRFVLGKGLK